MGLVVGTLLMRRSAGQSEMAVSDGGEIRAKQIPAGRDEKERISSGSAIYIFCGKNFIWFTKKPGRDNVHSRRSEWILDVRETDLQKS